MTDALGFMTCHFQSKNPIKNITVNRFVRFGLHEMNIPNNRKP